MNLFISANDKFILPAKVMLTSFLMHHPTQIHHIYFLYSAVQEENLSMLEHLVRDHGSAFHPVQLQESDFSGFKCTSRFPLLVYFRLLACHYLPESEDRALWMDVDLVVNGSVQAFYDQDFEGNAIVACRSISEQDRPLLFGHPEGTVYCNAGVMLYNAAVLRTYQLSDFYAYYQAHEDLILWQDQDILNGMFGGKIKALDNSTYNVQIRCGSGGAPYTLRYLQEEAKVIHFIGKIKPWHRMYFHRAASLWEQYYLKTCRKEGLQALCYRAAGSCRRCLVGIFLYIPWSLARHLKKLLFPNGSH